MRQVILLLTLVFSSVASFASDENAVLSGMKQLPRWTSTSLLTNREIEKYSSMSEKFSKLTTEQRLKVVEDYETWCQKNPFDGKSDPKATLFVFFRVHFKLELLDERIVATPFLGADGSHLWPLKKKSGQLHAIARYAGRRGIPYSPLIEYKYFKSIKVAVRE